MALKFENLCNWTLRIALFMLVRVGSIAMSMRTFIVNILQAKRKLNMIMHQSWCEKLPFKPKLRT